MQIQMTLNEAIELVGASKACSLLGVDTWAIAQAPDDMQFPVTLEDLLDAGITKLGITRGAVSGDVTVYDATFE